MIEWSWPLGRFFGGSLQADDFADLLDALDMDDGRVFGVPWGVNRDELVARLPDAVLEGHAPGRSEALLGFETALAGIDVELWFTVTDEGGLAHVAVDPSRRVPDAKQVLTTRFGKPDMEFDSHGERHDVWNREDCTLKLTHSGGGTVSLAIQPPSLR